MSLRAGLDAWHVLPMDSHPGIRGHRLAGEAITHELIVVAGFDGKGAEN